MFGSWIRHHGFWTVDFLKGGNIRKAYSEIKRAMELPYEEMKKEQEDAVRKLVKHAKDTTEYYKKTLDGKNDFSEFPVLNKNVIKKNYEQMRSSEYRDAKKHYMSTSGSTGTPFTMMQDMGKRTRVLAELIYFNERCENFIGDKFIFFRVWTEQNRNSRLAQVAKNMIPIDILHFTEENFERIRQILKSRKDIKVALGYVSTFEYLLKYLEKCGDHKEMFHLKTIITGSEIQEPELRKRLQNMFGCNVVSRYANEENGLIANQCITSEEFHVNSANYKVEILKTDADEEADYGELGRVVITDLYNYAFPMIRYDTGDLAVKIEKPECEFGGEVLGNIQGRRVDVIYDTKGNALTPHTWSVYMWKFDRLSQYQFIQQGEKEYTLKLNGAEGIYSDHELTEYLKSILGNDAKITLEHVSEIPCLKSGKFKKTVCNWKREE